MGHPVPRLRGPAGQAHLSSSCGIPTFEVVAGFVDGKQVGRKRVNELLVDESAELSFAFTPAAGQHAVAVTVDGPVSNVVESDEHNNDRTLALPALSLAYPDLAMTDLKVCKIPAEIVIDFSAKSRELQANLMHKWQNALATSDIWLTKLSTGPSRYRVIRLLIWLAETCSEEKFILPGRKDMGSILALTTETVSRLIAELRRDGLLHLHKNGYATADIGALKQIVREVDA